MLQRELPDDVYPDGAPSAFFSTSDMDSVADVAATGYGNLEKVYNNYFPQTCDDVAISDWERKAFGYNNDAALSLAVRQDLVIQRLRTRRGLTRGDMLVIVQSIIGSDKIIEIVPWCSSGGTWILDDNQLGITTILGMGPRLQAVDPMACELGPDHFGLTAEEWADIQDGAYTYSVLIYAYTLTVLERQKIDEQLSIYEPARSRHVIYDSLDPNNQVYSPPFFLEGGSPEGAGPDIIDGGSPEFAGPDITDGGSSF